MGPQDIYDQNYSLIMGFLWKVVRKYHVGLDGGGKAAGMEERVRQGKRTGARERERKVIL